MGRSCAHPMLALETRGTFTSRAIDFQLHGLFWSGIWRAPFPVHLDHQVRMCELLKGHEHAVFTDAVTYPFPDHFNGTTGTLTNLLSNCFFHLYEQMLDLGIPVNAEVDLTILYCLAFRFGSATPASEWNTVRRIVARLLPRAPSLPFLQPAYYTAYRELLGRANRELLEPSSTCSYYKEDVENRTLEFIQTRVPYAAEFIAIGEPASWQYGPCEYTPDYLESMGHTPLATMWPRLDAVERLFRV